MCIYTRIFFNLCSNTEDSVNAEYFHIDLSGPLNIVRKNEPWIKDILLQERNYEQFGNFVYKYYYLFILIIIKCSNKSHASIKGYKSTY